MKKDNTELKEDRDYCVIFTSIPQPNNWKQKIEIKVQTNEHDYTTVYVYIFVQLNDFDTKELCSSIVEQRFSNYISYVVNCKSIE